MTVHPYPFVLVFPAFAFAAMKSMIMPAGLHSRKLRAFNEPPFR